MGGPFFLLGDEVVAEVGLLVFHSAGGVGGWVGGWMMWFWAGRASVFGGGGGEVSMNGWVDE